MSTLEPRMERLEAADHVSVDPDAIEKQLASLWREASASRGGPAAVTRACLWNVIAYVPHDPGPLGETREARLQAAVDRLPRHLASRTLVLDAEPGPEPKLEAYVSANCILAEGGGKLVCSEEVTLAAIGDGRRHLPSVVRALLVPGVPTALVVAGAPDPKDELLRSVLRSADRVIFDADAADTPEALSLGAQAIAECRLGGIDLGWLRRAPLRGEIAALFDPPSGDVSALRRIEVRAARGEARTARLLLGWFVHALQAHSVTARPDGGWRGQRAAGPLELALDETGPGGELRVGFVDEGGALREVRCGARLESSGPCASPDRPTKAAPLEALIARALATRSEDASFTAALRVAEAL